MKRTRPLPLPPPSRGGGKQQRSASAATKSQEQRARSYPDSYHRFGFASFQGTPRLFETFHRHDEIELHFVEHGRLRYLFSRSHLDIPAGTLAVFWGAMPHKLIEFERDTRVAWLTVPLPWFLRWNLPRGFSQSVLKGEVFLESRASDAATLKQWDEDLRSKDAERAQTVLLECEARLRRMALSSRPAKKHERATPAGGEGHVEKMAAFVAAHYREPITTAQIAAEAKLNPDYATSLFRKATGMTLVDYITEHRISHAQRLLLMTQRKVLDIALDAGFGSLSRFYDAFTKACGKTPREFRVTGGG
ncbi:MAG TPA: helix-turn-helix domain-containing protein [Planctomycetota bacterium]|nr:helix-turn-helix domain-containing protein [Planctomycetota bacterium]